VGDYRWHRARALPVIASMHCHFCFTYNYHQKWPRTGLLWNQWQLWRFWVSFGDMTFWNI